MSEFYKLTDNLDEDIEAHAEDVKRYMSGDLAAGIFKARRVPRGIYEQRKDGSYMMRVRVAGGSLSSEQAVLLADIAEKYGDIHVTTRQDIQIHNVSIEDTPEVMRRLKSAGLTSKGGGGNTVRNVAACPFAGICSSECFDVAPYAYAVTEYLISLAGSYNLPRKYKIAFSGCGADCALARINDLGFIAQVQDGHAGFEVYAGGGMGAHSRAADKLYEWVPAVDTVKLAEAVRRLFDRTGDRHNRHRARLRFVFERMGADAVKAEIEKELAVLSGVPECNLGSELRVPVPDDKPMEYEAGGVRYFRQSQAGYVALRLSLPLGFISCSDFRVIAQVAEKYSAENGLVATRGQDLLLRYIREEQIVEVADALSELSADVMGPGSLNKFVACAGASTCRLGLCLARGAAKASAEYLDVSGIDMGDLSVNISGCPNSCGQHPVAEIGFFGAAIRKDEKLVPAYRVVLGAKTDDSGFRLSESVGLIPARAMPEFLGALSSDYTVGKNGAETFAMYFERMGSQYFGDMVGRYSSIPSYEDDAEYYKDWGAREDFSLAGRGAGECGAGVFEVVSEDIAAAKKAVAAGALDEAMLCAVRALLITRGVDTSDFEEISKAFQKHFIDTGLVGGEYVVARKTGQRDDILKFLDRIELLYSSMDSNLKFNIPGIDGEEAESNDDADVPAGLTVEYDLKGVGCPMNFVKAKLKLENISKGNILRVILDEGEPVRNVPASFKAEGQEVVSVDDLGDGHWAVEIRKSGE